MHVWEICLTNQDWHDKLRHTKQMGTCVSENVYPNKSRPILIHNGHFTCSQHNLCQVHNTHNISAVRISPKITGPVRTWGGTCSWIFKTITGGAVQLTGLIWGFFANTWLARYTATSSVVNACILVKSNFGHSNTQRAHSKFNLKYEITCPIFIMH